MRLVIDLIDTDEAKANQLLAELIDYAVHVEQASITDYWVEDA